MNALDFVTLLEHPKINADDSLAYASKLIIHKELEFLPVVADNGDFFGVIAAPSIAEALLSDTPENEQLAWEYCEREVLTVGPDDPIRKALAQMRAQEAEYFVVTENGRYIGFATTKDLVEALEFSGKRAPDSGDQVA